MGLCVSKRSTSVYGDESSSTSPARPAPRGTSTGSTRRARSSALDGLSSRAGTSHSSQWSSVRNSIRLSDPSDGRLTRAVNVLADLYRSSPAFRALADKVRDEGGVEIREANVSVASTDLTHRAILISPQTLSNAGSGEGPSLVSALVFEMNNLSRSAEAEAVYGLAQYGAFNANSYARELERIEYNSGLSSAQIFQEARGTLRSHGEGDHPHRWFLQEHPQNGSLHPMFDSFEDSLAYQHEVQHATSYENEFQRVFNNA